jgi:hypothetical protein
MSGEVKSNNLENGLSEALVLLQERKEEQFFKRIAAMDASGS